MYNFYQIVVYGVKLKRLVFKVIVEIVGDRDVVGRYNVASGGKPSHKTQATEVWRLCLSDGQVPRDRAGMLTRRKHV
jgi:hypothetical protein